MRYKRLKHGLFEGGREIRYESAELIFQRLYADHKFKFLFESKDVSPIYGRLSLAGFDPVLRLRGKKERFQIEVLNERGNFYFDQIKGQDLKVDLIIKKKDRILGVTKIKRQIFEESQRTRQKNISQIIRNVLARFAQEQRGPLGLYGVFSYDFVRLFEDIPEKLPAGSVPDFDLFLYDSFIFFDHLKGRAEIIAIRTTKEAVSQAIAEIETQLLRDKNEKSDYLIQNPYFSLSKNEYMDLVEVAKDYSRQGELFEVVFANTLKAEFSGDPFAFYRKYRLTNPSPYLFYFDACDYQLVGASPEMMARVEGGLVQMRPISGTAKRGADPIEDHENMLALLGDAKERAELDMLIDLGRNDLSRICQPGLRISDYRFVEKYSRVMHTVAHLTGRLRNGYTALDALIACLNAGTLTGAPKVAAMKTIENHERERRGFYGGTIGYLTFAGDLDSGIIIRTAYIQNGKLRFPVGATLLYRSDPAKEYQETINKAQAFLDTFNNNAYQP